MTKGKRKRRAKALEELAQMDAETDSKYPGYMTDCPNKVGIEAEQRSK